MRPNTRVLSRQVKDGGVLINLETNQIYDLNQTGYRIWQLLQEGLDYEAIRDRVAEEFAVDSDQLVQELDALIAHLTAEQLLAGDTDAAGSA